MTPLPHHCSHARAAVLAIFACTLTFGAAPHAAAQRADYARADRIRTYDPTLVGGRVAPVFLRDSVRFYYRGSLGAERGAYKLVDPRRGTVRPLFDHARVAASLSALAGTTVLPQALGAGVLVDDERSMQFTVGGRAYWCTLERSTCTSADSTRLAAIAGATPPSWASRSPDGKWDAFIWNYNLYLRPVATTDPAPLAVRRGAVRNGCDVPSVPGAIAIADSFPLPPGAIALTTDGTARRGYGLYHFGVAVARVDGERFVPNARGIDWAPDSRRFTAKRDDLRGVRIYPLYSSTSNQPVDHSYFYGAPGDSLVPRYETVVVDVARRSAVQVQLPPAGLLGAPDEVRWGRNADELFATSSNRGPTVITLAQVNPVTGAIRGILQETQPTFAALPSAGWHVSVATGDVFSVSERDGWGHLYRHGLDGTLRARLDSGDSRVARIVRVDTSARQLYFTAWGRIPGVPYYAHLFRVGFDGGAVTHLTPEEGNHTIIPVPHAPYFIDTYSTIATPPVTVLRNANGARVVELERGTTDGLRTTGWTPAEVVRVKARDGVTDLWGILHKPSDFDPSRRYPIVTVVYPGPQIGSVGDWVFKGPDASRGLREILPSGPEQIRIYSGDGMRRSLAELGFIVVELDAMGTAKRSKAFESFYFGNVRDNGLPDQIAAIRQLADRHPWIDTSRVGVWGHSGGGYSAAAAMFHHPDVFKVGVSQSGNHDFRIYGWYWGEKYQGPYERVGDSDNYEEEANYKYAAQLRGKLLIVTGDMDCNNPPAETLRVVDALMRAEKDFDMLVVPDHGHQMPPYVIRRAWDYFVEHLQGTTPPRGYRMIQ